MRLEKGRGGMEILDSSYSANPTGVLSALEHLRFWEGKKIVVLPSLIELGSSSKEIHVQLGRKIGETADLCVVTTKDQFSSLLKGAKEKGMKEENIVFLENPKEIAGRILSGANNNGVVLLEGRVPSGVLPLLKA
jgi:UDP-N-acetylmuramoyl-tripeptide--D-alanyl-D-alanine ligase